MALIADAFVLTFTSGISLRSWADMGLLEREWALYRRLESHYGRILLVTYGSSEDEAMAASLGPNVEAVCNHDGLDSAAYIARVPRLVAERLRDAGTVVVKTNQMMGGEAAIEITRNLRQSGKRVGLVARGGYLWSRFEAVELGSSTDEAIHAGSRERELCLAADVVVGTSIAMTGDLSWRHGLDPDRTLLVPNYVLPEAPVRDSHERDARTILYAGQLIKRKRVDLLIEAVAQVKGELAGLKLLLVGGGPEDARLKALARARGIERRVIFTGRVPHEEVQRYYGLLDVFVYPRHRMRLTDLVTPLKPLEAMAQGKLVLASDVGGHRELIEDGKTGYLFPADDRGGLVRALHDLFARRSAWPSLCAAARAFVERERSWDASASHYDPLYNKLIQQ